MYSHALVEVEAHERRLSALPGEHGEITAGIRRLRDEVLERGILHPVLLRFGEHARFLAVEAVRAPEIAVGPGGLHENGDGGWNRHCDLMRDCGCVYT
jgi:hypothetical protein